MSTILIKTNFNIYLEFPAAPFARRLVAWFLDIIVLIIYTVVAVKLMNPFSRAVGETASWVMFLILAVPFLSYHLISEILMNGQSVGKKIMGLRVVNENGGQPSIGQYIIRWLIRTSDIMAVVI